MKRTKIRTINILLGVVVLLTSHFTLAFENVKFINSINASLENPVDVSVSSTGDIYVLDQRTYRVNIYASTGELRRQFGGKGREPGSFSRPVGLAVGPEGQVAVADAGQNRVHLFDSKGQFVRAFGGSGKQRGRFNKLHAVAIDRFGFIYTCDTANKAVYMFSEQGILLEGVLFEEGSPQDIAVDREGYVYVLFPKSDHIYKARFRKGRPSTLKVDKGLTQASALHVDHNGDLYVSMSGRNSIVKYDSNGKLKVSFGSKGRGPGQFYGPTQLAGNSAGHLYVIDSRNKRAQAFQVGNPGEPVRALTQSPPTVELDTTENYGEYIAALDWAGNGELLALSRKHARILRKGVETRVQGAPGRKEGQFRDPQGLAALSDGRVVVADTLNHRIQILDAKGNAFSVGEKGRDNGQFNGPTAVAVSSQNLIYVADTGNYRIQVFTDQGIFLSSFGEKSKFGKGEEPPHGSFKKPVALAVDSQDRLVVVDVGNKRVELFDDRGKYLRTLASFIEPVDVAIDEQDRFFIADNGCNCVRAYDAKGGYLMSFGSLSEGPGYLGDIGAIAAQDGEVLVADASNHSVKVFKVALQGLKKEERVQVTQSFYVPESVLGNPSELAKYRTVALDKAAQALAQKIGTQAGPLKQKLKVDNETILAGGEVRLLVSVPKPLVSRTQTVVQEEPEDDGEFELKF